MLRQRAIFPSARPAALADAVAILAFVVVGLLSHQGGISARGLARDALPLLAGWACVALLVRLYTRPSAQRLLVTWLTGITAGVAARAAILRHTHAGKEATFLAVALVVTLVFAVAARLVATTASALRP